VLGIVAPPAVRDDSLPGLQIRQGADKGDEALVIQGGDRVAIAAFWGEAGHREAVLWVLKRDPLDYASQFTTGRRFGGGEGAWLGCERHEDISRSEGSRSIRMVARASARVENST
jgi:hypothetical protein